MDPPPVIEGSGEGGPPPRDAGPEAGPRPLALSALLIGTFLMVGCDAPSGRDQTDPRLRTAALGEDLRDPDPEVRRRALVFMRDRVWVRYGPSSLGLVCEDVLPVTRSIVASPNDPLRPLAVGAMRAIRYCGTDADLQRILEDRAEAVALRMEAARGLSAALPSAQAALVRALESPAEPLQLRLVAMRALAVSCSVPSAVFVRVLDDHDPVLSAGAVEILGKRGAVEELRTALRHSDAKVRDATVSVLKGRGWSARPALPELRALLSQEPIPPSFWASLAAIGPVTVPLLVEALASPDTERRLRVIGALGQMGVGAKAAIPALEELATAGDERTRRAVSDALERIGPSLSELARRLQSPDPEVRRRTVAAISSAVGRLRAEAAELVPHLRETLKDPVPVVRAEAAWPLVEIGEPAGVALDDLVRLLADEEEFVRRRAALALGTLCARVPRADIKARVRAALEASRDDPDEEVRGSVEQALRQVNARPQPSACVGAW